MEQERLIEKYLQNKLSGKEKQLFDELLKNDIQFKEEVALHTNIKKITAFNDDANFKNLVSKLENKASSTNKKPSYTKWLVAASIVVLLGSFYVINLNKNVSSNELFATYFEPYRNVIQPIERGNTQEDKKTQAFTAYENGEYETAITLFSELQTTTNESFYLFYKANALLQLEKANESIPLLLEHLKTNDTLTQKTNWYLALAYLKIDDKINAKKRLNTVVASKMYKMDDAIILLNKLD
jgi:predicted Zn-dependent protease